MILDAEELDDFLKYLILEFKSWLFGITIEGRPCILKTSLILHRYSVGSSGPSWIILQIWADAHTKNFNSISLFNIGGLKWLSPVLGGGRGGGAEKDGWCPFI